MKKNPAKKEFFASIHLDHFLEVLSHLIKRGRVKNYISKKKRKKMSQASSFNKNIEQILRFIYNHIALTIHILPLFLKN